MGAWRNRRCAAMAMRPLRHFADAVLHPRLARLPAGAAQAIELRFGVLGAVARQQFDVFDRQIELVAAGVMDFEAIMRRAGGRDRLETDETADAVIDMDDQIAGRQRRDFAEQIFRAACVLRRRRTSRSPRISCSPSTARPSVSKPCSTPSTASETAPLPSASACGSDATCWQVVGRPCSASTCESRSQRAVGPAGDDDGLAGVAQRRRHDPPPPERH